MKNYPEQTSCQAYLKHQAEAAWQRYLRELGRCKKEFAEDAVHDLRVAIRRLITVLNAAGTMYSDGNSEAIRKILKKQMKVFSPLRDVQVQLLFIRKFYFSYPVLYNYYVNLLEKEKQMIGDARRTVKNIDISDFEGHMFFFRMNLASADVAKVMDFQGIVGHAYEIYGLLTESIKAARASDPRSIHRVRLIFKKFRYSMEILEPLLRISRVTMKNMHTFQTMLGEIQDATVLLRDLRYFAEKQPDLPEMAFASAIEAIAARQAAAIAEFYEFASIVKSFWKKEWNALDAKK